MPVHTAHFCFAQASQTDCVRQRVRLRSRYKHGKARALRQRGGHVPAQRTLCPPRRVVLREHVAAPVLPVPGSSPCVSSPPAKRGRGGNPPHRIGAPRVLIEPTRTFRSAGNGDGSCRSRHGTMSTASSRGSSPSGWRRAFVFPGGRDVDPGVDLEIHCQLDARHLARVGPPQCRQPALERPHRTAAVRPSRRLIRKAVAVERCCTAGSGAAACQGCIGCTAERRRRSASTRAVYTAAMKR
ncbi:hypothetical protein DIPPA_05872 [Diplonema papillatum]|nr:hypothetical protein DIPPA_05872 [Diplonema papillatum]